MGARRLMLYVTLLPDSKTAEFYAVAELAGGGSDLWSDGCSHWSSLPSEVASSLTDWLKEMTADG